VEGESLLFKLFALVLPVLLRVLKFDAFFKMFLLFRISFDFVGELMEKKE